MNTQTFKNKAAHDRAPIFAENANETLVEFMDSLNAPCLNPISDDELFWIMYENKVLPLR